MVETWRDGHDCDRLGHQQVLPRPAQSPIGVDPSVSRLPIGERRPMTPSTGTAGTLALSRDLWSAMWPVNRPRRNAPAKLLQQLVLCASHPEQILFLDIETTGLSHYYDEITVIGWSFDGQAKTIVKGDDPQPFRNDAARAEILVTFNGIRFDTKFIANEHADVVLPERHVDLMYLCRRLGLKGGQKSIEKQLNIKLRDGLEEVDGAAAVMLWHRYLRGDAAALRELVRYNRADIAAMGAILDRAIVGFEFHPDLFVEGTSFRAWSAPEGWCTLPEDLPKAPPPTRSPPPRFEDLFGDASQMGTQRGAGRGASVVGIDLSGSETRGSGWCFLEEAHAQVAMLYTDAELLEHTVAKRPDIVSIDSPLCLPSGRNAVDDSDPARERFGIIRESERELKRRGVNVYPCLIQSMQKLTARGIRLAQELRSHGIPVIESYPGAAQDIMRIPRKGAGIEWLKQGLQDFGVTGEYESEKVTHDELDAITSALVGRFHLAGLTEALGTEEEPPLIVPKLKEARCQLAIGISGPIAAGKTTLARCLERRGFAYTRFSLVIDDLLAEQGLSRDRLNRQRLGNEINTSGRQRWLSAQTLKRVGDAERIVIDGLRFPDDHAFMVEQFGDRFRHVFIDAGEEVRCARYEEGKGKADFDDASRANVERRVVELRSLAHEVFVNKGEMSEVERKADELVTSADR